MKISTNFEDIEPRTYKFAINIIKLVNEFPRTTAAYVLGRQIIRSGSSINSNIIHARNSLTRKELIYYFNHAKWESKETKCWIQMSQEANLIDPKLTVSLLKENEEIIKILVKIVKNSQENK